MSLLLSEPPPAPPEGARIPVLYLAPWVDFGGSDKGTVDWFKWIDRERFAPSLITTQPSANRRLAEVYPYAEEVWPLPEHLAGLSFPRCIFDFVHTREVQVLHVMNSRIAFELLPDLASLRRPPAVVIQLHVEEPDRSGYVRYVCTRYGNLVDAFSVTSEHLARAVVGYDIPRSKVHVIATGVDAEGEFNPERITLHERLADDRAFTILAPGRLVEQKDPLLTVEVIAEVLGRHTDVRVEIIGDGPLEPAVRRRIDELGLGDHVCVHPPTDELARWLAGSDALLMTSEFEGVPYTVYEAMAMGVPVVAPALPGNVELMGDAGGFLIDPRDDRDAYVEALSRLIADAGLRKQIGAEARSRMLKRFTLRQMAANHEALYETLLSPRRPSSAAPAPIASPLEPLRLCNRPTRGSPLVSVVTPCFNHGRYLSDLMEGIDTQDYPAIEVIVVDDASSDPQTLEELERLQREERVTVIRNERNSGPSRARNRAIAAAEGRYILPVDADNILLPGAVTSLVEQLRDAGERVGFIYPSFQCFGTRDHRFDPPAYNLFSLLHGNFVDTCSLFDREIFDAGLRYPEDIQLGHEDWDLALTLGARGVIGEPSRQTVMLYRKQGFTRSDLVEYLQLPFSTEIRERHPDLYGSQADVGGWGRYKGPAMEIKRRWSPAVSIVCPVPVDLDDERGQELLTGLRGQTCRDSELIVECPLIPSAVAAGEVPVRRIPPGLARTSAERVQEALDLSRGRFLLVSLRPVELMRDPTTVEKLARGFMVDHELMAVALADLGPAGRFPFRLLPELDRGPQAHSLAWRRDAHNEIVQVHVRPGCELGGLADAMVAAELPMHWRHFPVDRPDPGPGTSAATSLELDRHLQVPGRSPSDRERQERLTAVPAIPAIEHDGVRRWTWSAAWMPPETRPLARHVSHDGTRRIITNDRAAPPGFKLEFDIGSIQRYSPPGTERLACRDGSFLTLPRGSEREDDDEELGHLEQSRLPLFVGVERALLDDGSETLVLASPRDPVRERARELTLLGFLEGYPNEPIKAPAHTRISPNRA